MRRFKRERNTLYCFSPPVMIATFAIEIMLALYAWWRYKLNDVTKPIILILLFLAAFQGAEFMVCRGLGGDSLLWSRAGFIAITMLPPLGIHLIYNLVKADRRPLLLPAYGAAAFFLGFFGLGGSSIQEHSCMGNYVIFQVAPGFGGLYGIYYYSLLITTLILGWRYLQTTQDEKIKKALGGLMIGYTIFLLPATTANFLKPETLAAIPSIMCGFAVLLALMLAFRVLPNAAERRMKKG